MNNFVQETGHEFVEEDGTVYVRHPNPTDNISTFNHETDDGKNEFNWEPRRVPPRATLYLDDHWTRHAVKAGGISGSILGAAGIKTGNVPAMILGVIFGISGLILDQNNKGHGVRIRAYTTGVGPGGQTFKVDPQKDSNNSWV